jgi:hypothetical protein
MHTVSHTVSENVYSNKLPSHTYTHMRARAPSHPLPVKELAGSLILS